MGVRPECEIDSFCCIFRVIGGQTVEKMKGDALCPHSAVDHLKRCNLPCDRSRAYVPEVPTIYKRKMRWL